jgi:hypothetical protein
LELGKHLVSELKLEESRDTLAKWLAHHVAELIVTAEQEPNPAKRRKAAEYAVDTILRIWSQRDHLPGNANPFAPYRSILQVLSALSPSADCWPGRVPNHPVVNLHRRFPRLVQALLVLLLPRSGKGSHAARKAVHQFLEADESRLLHALEFKIRILGIHDEGAEQNAEPEDDFARVERVANKLIDETLEDLNAVRGSSISRTSPKSTS